MKYKPQILYWRRIFSKWVILGGITFGLILTFTFITLLWSMRSPQPLQGSTTAILRIIPLPTPSPILLPSATSIPTPTLPPMPGEGMISVGAYVQITGTGTDGLRLRESPGLDGKVKFIGIEAEVFLVQDGPREADGYTWWFLTAPYDDTVQGWAVSNYLSVIQNP